MNARRIAWNRTLGAVAWALLCAGAAPARAQFVPGRIFTAGGSDIQCKVYLNDYVFELDPETGYTNIFASMPPNSCAGLASVAMSPDGKHLRVAARNWGAILEFDAEGNWEVVIDGSDGVYPAADWDSITYDREGNFYLSNYYTLNAKVIKFPADGGPKQVLAYYDNDGVILEGPYGLSVGPSGEVYAADYERIIRIAEDGVVSFFDSTPNGAFVYSVLVDDFGHLHAKTGGYWYRYALGDPDSREIFAQCVSLQGLCGSTGIELSPDRTRVYTDLFDYSTSRYSMIAVDPHDGSYQTVVNDGGGPSFAVVPLRGDVDGDGDADLSDLAWLVACMDGPEAGRTTACDLADMDADGDVDLFDVRFFLIAHSRRGGTYMKREVKTLLPRSAFFCLTSRGAPLVLFRNPSDT